MWWSCLALLPFAVACPEGFREFKEGCYMFTEEQGSMTQCQDRICTSKGATLAVVHDVEVQFFLSNLTHEYQAPAFLGLFERGSNESGDWTWIDGSNMTFETDVNETVNPLAGWAFSEPDNWCLDEDCAALGVDYIANYSEMKFGMFAQLLRPARSVGFFDISCSTQLHCLCQTGNVVSEDFLLWEFNNSATQDENSLHVNKTYWENYATCFHKRTRCWWYTDNNFQMTFVLVSVLCLTGIVFSMTGCSGGVQREVTLNDATAASNYGQLLEACDRQSEVDSTVDRWIVRGAWASMLYGVMLVLLSLTTMCAVTAPGDTEPRPLWSEPRDDDVTYEAELAVTSRTSDMSLFSDLTPPTTTLLQREDEAAYQAALAKARRLQNRETKRLTRQVSSGHTEHWQIRLRDFMQTALMESICAGVIFTNSILIGVQTDYMAKRLGEEQPLVFTVVDAAYTAIFGLELSVRLLGSGLGFFYRDPGLFWNYLDVIIVLPSIMELVLAFFLQLPAVSTDITVIRILRITRVFRVIRVVKVMKFIRSLRQLVESVMHTMRSLAWSMLLLIVIIYVFAIMFTDASASFQEFSPESVLNADLKSYFGDLHTSMHTLFRSVSGGIDWGMVAHPLGEVHWIWMYLFSLYVAFCMFAVLNVMTGIFCQVAVESSWNDPQLLLQHSMVERERQHDLIRQLFQSFRQETTRRKITLIDIEENFDDDGVQGLMNLLDIYPETGWSLFKQLDDNGDASISEEEFVSGVFRLKGAAKSWDMEIIMQEQRGLRKILDTYIATVAGSDKRRAATASG